MLRRVMKFVWEKQWDGRGEGERGRETWREGGEMRERERDIVTRIKDSGQTSLFSLPWQPSLLNC